MILFSLYKTYGDAIEVCHIILSLRSAGLLWLGGKKTSVFMYFLDLNFLIFPDFKMVERFYYFYSRLLCSFEILPYFNCTALSSNVTSLSQLSNFSVVENGGTISLF